MQSGYAQFEHSQLTEKPNSGRKVVGTRVLSLFHAHVIVVEILQASRQDLICASGPTEIADNFEVSQAFT